MRELVELLGALRADRAHPLTREIEHDTLMDWTTEDSDWATYRRLLAAIQANLGNG